MSAGKPSRRTASREVIVSSTAGPSSLREYCTAPGSRGAGFTPAAATSARTPILLILRQPDKHVVRPGLQDGSPPHSLPTLRKQGKEIAMFHLIGQIIFGLVVGVIAKFIMPGKDPGGLIVTAIIGMVGSLVGTFIGRMLWGGAGYESGWITSILGAVLLLAIYRLIKSKVTT